MRKALDIKLPVLLVANATNHKAIKALVVWKFCVKFLSLCEFCHGMELVSLISSNLYELNKLWKVVLMTYEIFPWILI